MPPELPATPKPPELPATPKPPELPAVRTTDLSHHVWQRNTSSFSVFFVFKPW